MRWLAILACAGGGPHRGNRPGAGQVRILSISPSRSYFFRSPTWLTPSWAAISSATSRAAGNCSFSCLWQMLGDFTALSFLTYALGCIETPMGALFMAHIILATILFSRWHSLMIASRRMDMRIAAPDIGMGRHHSDAQHFWQGQFKLMVNASFGATFGFVSGQRRRLSVLLVPGKRNQLEPETERASARRCLSRC